MSEPQGFPPYEPSPDLPATVPPRMAAPGHLIGRAQGVQTRVEPGGSESSSKTVLSFRLLDAVGTQHEVELRGLTLTGTVRDGDWVDVADHRGRSGRIEVASLANLTTASEVSAPGSLATGPGRTVAIVLLVVFLAIFLIVAAVIAVGALTMMGGS